MVEVLQRDCKQCCRDDKPDAVTLAGVSVAFGARAVVSSGDEVTFEEALVVFGCALVTFGPCVVSRPAAHCSSSCTITFPA